MAEFRAKLGIGYLLPVAFGHQLRNREFLFFVGRFR